ncbi:T9SS type A sorting domain-containing protein [Polaribacter marinivivus]|uniref:T9SS type A sorting domain-containing protein n=1 Tax=Polaribacter marinivivus TaxID=1524260 RepID=UPI003D3373D9
MKKITLLFALLISSIGFSQELLTDGNFESQNSGGGVTGAWYGAGEIRNEGGGNYYFANVATAGTPFSVNLSQKGLNLESGKAYKLAFDASSDRNREAIVGIGLSADPWTNKVETINLTTTSNRFEITLVANFTNTDARVIFDLGAAVGVVVIDNVSLTETTPPAGPTPPSTKAPIPPARNAADVVSIFSDAYTNITVDTFDTSWCAGTTTEITVEGDKVKRVTDLGCEGVEFISSRFDASSFTHFHMDIFVETSVATQDKSFNLKLSNWNGGTEEANAIEFSTTNGSNPALPATNPGTWISLDIPLSSWTPGSRNDITQFIITSDLGTVFYDNLYFYKASGGNGGNTGASGDLTNWTFDDAASVTVFNKIADAAADASASINFNATGNGTGALELVGVNTNGGAGKNYSYRYENANFDFKGNSEFKISFDAKFVGNYVGAAFHTGIQVPNTTSGAGVKQINKFDLQGQINNSTWSTVEFNVSDADFNGSNGLFIFDFQIAAGADANAGGTVLIDNFKISGLTTASVDNNTLLGFSMYPNPANNVLNISAKETIKNADIFNVLGKKVMSVNINKANGSIDVSNLSSGIYLIKYNVNDKVGTAKFIKQ